MSAKQRTFRLHVEPAVSLNVLAWEPVEPAKAVVLVAHGMAEHAERYARVAARLVAAGYAVYAPDHRGHGRSIERPEDLGYFGDGAGFSGVIEDLERLRRHALADHPGLPVLILGHSMGSFAVRNYLFARSTEVAAVAISGTAGGQVPLVHAARTLALGERLRLGRRGRSALLHRLSFGDYNRKFEPIRTESDWLSRDPAEVDKYVADPLCGFVLSVQGWVEVLTAIIDMQRPESVRRMRKDLPLYLFSGSDDPVGRSTEGVRETLKLFEEAGLSNVTHRFYAGGRHEMLNEINRDEVEQDLVDFFERALANGSPVAHSSA